MSKLLTLLRTPYILTLAGQRALGTHDGSGKYVPTGLVPVRGSALIKDTLCAESDPVKLGFDLQAVNILGLVRRPLTSGGIGFLRYTNTPDRPKCRPTQEACPERRQRSLHGDLRSRQCCLTIVGSASDHAYGADSGILTNGRSSVWRAVLLEPAICRLWHFRYQFIGAYNL